MAVDMFLKLDGIDGESTDDQHLKWIELESFSWSVSQTGSLGSSGGASGRAVPADFSVVMPFSAASPNVFLKLVTGQHIDSATVSVRQAGSPTDFLKYDFDTVFMTKLDWVGGKTGRPRRRRSSSRRSRSTTTRPGPTGRSATRSGRRSTS